YFFFFQAADGIRDATVTGVQTCALPISPTRLDVERALGIPHPPQCELHHAGTRERNDVTRDDHAGIDERAAVAVRAAALDERDEIGRASCRERVEVSGVGGWVVR